MTNKDMKNRNAILDTVVALLDQSEEIINRLETIQEKRPLTKKEEEILKQEVRNKNAAYRMAIFA
jgi:hypothetical protein|tara:strand:- start:7526 stop:7720 length:195 start_codon:yes stop_codon:yes gene_type:complete